MQLIKNDTVQKHGGGGVTAELHVFFNLAPDANE
jgi:hypothetical protein